MTLATFIVGASSGDSYTSLLRSGYSGKAGRARTLDITTHQRALGVRTTCSILFARINALEVDAGLIGGAVVVGSAPYLAHSRATYLTSGTLLARYTGDVTHAVRALLSHEAIIGISASKHALALVAS